MDLKRQTGKTKPVYQELPRLLIETVAVNQLTSYRQIPNA